MRIRTEVPQPAALDFLQLVHLRAAGATDAQVDALLAKGLLSPRVGRIVKANEIGVGDMADLADFRVAVNGFIEALANVGAFDRALTMMRRVPLQTDVRISTVASTGDTPGAGQSNHIVKFDIDSAGGIGRRISSAIAVVSRELLRAASPGASALLNNELRAACVRAVDGVFITELLADVGVTNTLIASGDIGDDLTAMVAALATGQTSRLLLIISPASARLLVGRIGTAGILFPDLSLAGGRIGSIAVAVSDVLTDNDAVLVDCDGLAGDAEGINFDTAEHADIEMRSVVSSSATSPPTHASELVSMWQTNSAALRFQREWGFVIARTAAVSAMSGFAAVTSP